MFAESSENTSASIILNQQNSNLLSLVEQKWGERGEKEEAAQVSKLIDSMTAEAAAVVVRISKWTVQCCRRTQATAAATHSAANWKSQTTTAAAAIWTQCAAIVFFRRGKCEQTMDSGSNSQ